jgi:hypothetical protein
MKPWEETWHWTDTWQLRPEDPPYRHGFHKLLDERGAMVISDGSACGEYGADIDVEGPYGHLIAAAPELYRALEAIVSNDLTGYTEAVGKAALRKARGEATDADMELLRLARR